MSVSKCNILSRCECIVSALNYHANIVVVSMYLVRDITFSLILSTSFDIVMRFPVNDSLGFCFIIIVCVFINNY